MGEGISVDFPAELLDDEIGADEEDAATRVAAQLAEDVGVGQKRASKASPWPKSKVEKAARESAEMRKTRDWSEAKPQHLVALYDFCHAYTYGDVPSELAQGGNSYAAAVSMATRMLDVDFGGDVEQMVGSFMRWAWSREKRREGWRRDNAVTDRPRLGWRAMFKVGGALVVDWRIEQARKGEVK